MAVFQLHHRDHLHHRHTTPLNSQCSQCTNSRQPRRWHSRTEFPHNCITMSNVLVVVILFTHMRNWMKYFWFLSPTQLLIQGQWWSIRLERKDWNAFVIILSFVNDSEDFVECALVWWIFQNKTIKHLTRLTWCNVGRSYSGALLEVDTFHTWVFIALSFEILSYNITSVQSQ